MDDEYDFDVYASATVETQASVAPAATEQIHIAKDETYMPEDEDVMQMLSSYTEYLQWEWATLIFGYVFQKSTHPQYTISILSGDAGTGKSSALCHLQSLFRDCHMEDLLLLTATTNAGTGGSNTVRTLHSAFLLNNFNLLTACDSGVQKLMLQYKSYHGSMREMVINARSGYQQAPTHECRNIRLRCGQCCAYMKDKQCPPIAYAALVVIDEYGMMTAQLLDIVVTLLQYWSPTFDYPDLVLCGAVTQLPPYKVTVKNRHSQVAANARHAVYDHQALTKPTFTFKLPFSVRGLQDPMYYEIVNMFQYNYVSPYGVNVLQRRCQMSSGDAMNVNVLPNVMRIVHDNDSRLKYIENMHDRLHRSNAEQIDVRARYNSKNTKDEASLREKVNHKYRLLAVGQADRMYVGELVCVRYVKHDMKNKVCLLMGKDEVYSGDYLVKDINTEQEMSVPCINDTHKSAFVAIAPIVNTNAINTYMCQGCTYNTPIIYRPPKCYTGPLTASAYVVLTRVTNRNLLITTSNSYLHSRNIWLDHFLPACVRFHIRCEDGYCLS